MSVSVVIPTYNRAATCRRAVESALAQEPAPLEVLVCDDGSTDGTQAEFSTDERVRYIRLDRSHGGPGAARNRGLRAARGEWVAFLDDDDEWLPGKLATQLACLRSGEVDLVASDALRTSGGRYFGRGQDWRPTRQDLLDDNPVIVSSAVVRKELLLALGGFPAHHLQAGTEDYAAWLGLSDLGARFLILDAPLVRYEDTAAVRLSHREARMQRALVRLALRRWLHRPLRFELFRAAGNQVVRSWQTLRGLR